MVNRKGLSHAWGPLQPFSPVWFGAEVRAARGEVSCWTGPTPLLARSSGVVTNDPAFVAGHPLQAGFLTSAAGKGASIFKMMDVSRHKSVDTLRGHVRDAELFRDHAGAGLL